MKKRTKGWCLGCVRRALANSKLPEDLWSAFEEVIPAISDLHGTIWGECVGDSSEPEHSAENQELIVVCQIQVGHEDGALGLGA